MVQVRTREKDQQQLSAYFFSPDAPDTKASSVCLLE
jgi:hypothetical protein